MALGFVSWFWLFVLILGSCFFLGFGSLIWFLVLALSFGSLFCFLVLVLGFGYCFLVSDLSKAFNCLDHSKLLVMLYDMGDPTCAIWLLKS